MTLMTHSALPGTVIDVPASAVAFWTTKGWAVASAGAVATPRSQVQPPVVYITITNPALPGRSARIPFATVPPVYALLGWV